jgi:hypothetical protein
VLAATADVSRSSRPTIRVRTFEYFPRLVLEHRRAHFQLGCAAAVLSAAPALAQSAGSTAESSVASKPDITNMQQSLKQDLAKAGFTDIKVSPASFNVHATNSSGQKTYMLIGPQSLTEFVSAQGADAQQPNSVKSATSK